MPVMPPDQLSSLFAASTIQNEGEKMAYYVTPNFKENRLCIKIACRLRSRGVKLPPTSGEPMDVDTLSGHLLDLFKNTGKSFLFDAFHKLNAERLAYQVSRSPWASAWSFNHAEMAAEIFYDIFRFAHTFTFRGGVSFRAWIRVITHNKIKKTLRSRATIPIVYTSNFTEISDRHSSDPLFRLICKEKHNSLLAGWWILVRICAQGIRVAISQQEREVLWLNESKGMSYRALSKRLKISRREAVSTARRGRRKVAGYLRKRLASTTQRINASKRESPRAPELGNVS